MGRSTPSSPVQILLRPGSFLGPFLTNYGGTISSQDHLDPSHLLDWVLPRRPEKAEGCNSWGGNGVWGLVITGLAAVSAVSANAAVANEGAPVASAVCGCVDLMSEKREMEKAPWFSALPHASNAF